MLLTAGMFCAAATYAQVTLFEDDFESGGANWSLNGGSGGNSWTITNDYTGYSPFVEDTPAQPGGTVNGPYSTYMHIYNASACGALAICNASFDTGSTSNQPTTLASGITTTGYGNVTLSFIYLCAGQTGSAYGTIEYSVDNGSTWTSAGVTYVNVVTWTNASLTLPAWTNQANLKIRFRWQNGSVGNDPAFAIDEVKIEGTAGTFASVSATAPSPNQFCATTQSSVTVNFTASGTINAGNTYTAELSNAAGSFSSPTTIGTLSSSATGALSISGTIPNTIPAGSGYRIRVNSSDPVSTGTDNGVNLAVNSLPTISILGNPLDGNICNGESASLLANGGSTYFWTPAATLSNPTSAATSATPANTTVYVATGTDANGCTNTASFTVTVNSCADITEEQQNVFELFPNPTSDVVFISVDPTASVYAVDVLDLSGRIIQSYSEVPHQLELSELNNGTYIIRMNTSNGSTAKYVIKN